MITESAFVTDLFFKDLNREAPEGQIRLMLTQPLVYNSVLLDWQIVVPATFVTDLGSVPRPLWGVVSPIGRADCAFVVHDWLYQKGTVDRGQADGVLREAMEVCGVRKSLRVTIWLGVRAGGTFPWNRYRKAERVEAAAKGL